jgi:hypothetical protein
MPSASSGRDRLSNPLSATSLRTSFASGCCIPEEAGKLGPVCGVWLTQQGCSRQGRFAGDTGIAIARKSVLCARGQHG